jgi:glutamyl-tRNA synthetase
MERYREQAERLLAGGLAYRCFCDESRLEAQRLEAELGGRPPRYDGACRDLARADVERRLAAGEPAAVRLRIPDGDVVIADASRGAVAVPAGTFGDFVILRSNGHATYTFATAVDDADMDITHVIRGEDHLSNTARQLSVLRALGLREPRYAHYGLLLDEDGQKLSKSHGAESIADFRNEGYPPEAIVNYVATLICPPGDGVDEVASMGALAGRFSLSSLSAGVARFDRRKLDWLSQEHLKRLNPLDLASRVGRALELRGVGYHPSQLTALAEGLRGAHTITEAADEAQQVIGRRSGELDLDEQALTALGLFREVREGWPEAFLSHHEAEELLDELRAAGAERGIGARDLLGPLRLALTGARRGVAMPYVIAAIERDDALARVERVAV